MKNNKFLKVGAAALGAIALTVALGINHGEAQTHQEVVKQDNVVQISDSNPHNFTTIDIQDRAASQEMPSGTVKEVTYKGKVIGEIRQNEKTRQISTNLSPEETVRVFHELQKEKQADHITLTDGMQKEPEYKKIVFDLGNESKTYISDVETVVLSASMSYRTNNVANTPSKEDVTKSIKEARAKYFKQHTNSNNLAPNAG